MCVARNDPSIHSVFYARRNVETPPFQSSRAVVSARPDRLTSTLCPCRGDNWNVSATTHDKPAAVSTGFVIGIAGATIGVLTALAYIVHLLNPGLLQIPPFWMRAFAFGVVFGQLTGILFTRLPAVERMRSPRAVECELIAPAFIGLLPFVGLFAPFLIIYRARRGVRVSPEQSADGPRRKLGGACLPLVVQLISTVALAQIFHAHLLLTSLGLR